MPPQPWMDSLEDVDADAIIPGEGVKNAMIQKTLRVWRPLVQHARSKRFYPRQSFLDESILHNVPNFIGTVHSYQRPPQHSYLLTSGRSTWRVGEECELKKKSLDHTLVLGISKATSCTMTRDHGFATWLGAEGAASSNDNFLAVLTFAWAYIISARWAESQGGRLSYTNTRAPSSRKASTSYCILDIGDSDDSEARWWMAVTARGEGWRATIPAGAEVEYMSPWSVSVDGAPGFAIRSSSATEWRGGACASSYAALRYLSRFCEHHAIVDQGLAALSAALVLPTHATRRISAAQLPAPTRSENISPGAVNQSGRETLRDAYDSLGRYMTISAFHFGVTSILCSIFFDDEVPCNLSSQWLETILDILRPIENQSQVVAIIGALRRPCLGAWWLGASLTGLARVILHDDVKDNFMPIHLPLWWWTGSPQSFLCRQRPVPSVPEWIPRWEEALLLYLSGEDGRSEAPLSPWGPPGRSRLQDTILCVQAHAHCSGHRLRYTSWTSDDASGIEYVDYGHSLNVHHSEPHCYETSGVSAGNPGSYTDDQTTCRSEMASKQYTVWMFEWLAGAAERSVAPRDIVTYNALKQWASEIYPDSDSSLSDVAWEDRSSSPGSAVPGMVASGSILTGNEA